MLLVCLWWLSFGDELRVAEGFEEGDEGLFVFGAEEEAAAWVFGEVGVEGVGVLDAFAVVIEDLFEGGEATVVHVGGGEGDVAEAGGGEGAAVEGGFRREEVTEIFFIDGEAVVAELVVGEEGTAVAVEAVAAHAAEAGFALGHEELEAEFFEVGEFGFATMGAVEFGIEGGESEEEIFEGE